MRFSLKKKLIVSYSVTIVITGLITIIIGTFLISRGVINQVQDKVRTDLNSAREIWNNRISTIRDAVYFATLRKCLKSSIAGKNRESLKNCLSEIRVATKMEIATIVDKNGIVILRARNQKNYGDSLKNNQIIKKVLSSRQILAGPVIIPREELIKEGKDLADQAHIHFLNTPKAKRMMKGEETSGMMLIAAAPIWSDNGEFIGILFGGDLINRNYSLVDKIKSIVYQGETYNSMDMGTATIFQSDLRISTNVMTNEGERAIGTRVSEEVFDKVLGEGKQWIDRAFVVNAWYITAYEPIKDVDDNIIGILYVGMLEQKYVDIRTRTLLIFFGVALLGMILILIVSNIFANKITRPINYLVRVSRQISEGDFSVKVEVNTKDELGELEKAFNAMAIALQQRDEELKDQTQRQLMRSEKMAALGRMAAGIAHEINNPLTGVLMYGHLLLKGLPEGSRNRDDAGIIVNETTRCRELIRNLLDFSRETVPHKELVNIDDVIDKTISIIEKQVYFENVEIVKQLAKGLPKIMVDINQLEQVLINLALNGAEAMTEGGKLIFITEFDRKNNDVIIKVTDTGNGISDEDKDRIFDPFFTTKAVGKGTGLGLAVTYGIVKRHMGQINVESKTGSGTTFRITLPVESPDTSERKGDT